MFIDNINFVQLDKLSGDSFLDVVLYEQHDYIMNDLKVFKNVEIIRPRGIYRKVGSVKGLLQKKILVLYLTDLSTMKWVESNIRLQTYEFVISIFVNFALPSNFFNSRLYTQTKRLIVNFKNLPAANNDEYLELSNNIITIIYNGDATDYLCDSVCQFLKEMNVRIQMICRSFLGNASFENIEIITLGSIKSEFYRNALKATTSMFFVIITEHTLANIRFYIIQACSMLFQNYELCVATYSYQKKDDGNLVEISQLQNGLCLRSSRPVNVNSILSFNPIISRFIYKTSNLESLLFIPANDEIALPFMHNVLSLSSANITKNELPFCIYDINSKFEMKQSSEKLIYICRYLIKHFRAVDRYFIDEIMYNLFVQCFLSQQLEIHDARRLKLFIIRHFGWFYFSRIKAQCVKAVI